MVTSLSATHQRGFKA